MTALIGGLEDGGWGGGHGGVRGCFFLSSRVPSWGSHEFFLLPHYYSGGCGDGFSSLVGEMWMGCCVVSVCC